MCGSGTTPPQVIRGVTSGQGWPHRCLARSAPMACCCCRRLSASVGVKSECACHTSGSRTDTRDAAGNSIMYHLMPMARVDNHPISAEEPAWMPAYKYRVGQVVEAAAKVFGAIPPGRYEIIRLMPPTVVGDNQ